MKTWASDKNIKGIVHIFTDGGPTIAVDMKLFKTPPQSTTQSNKNNTMTIPQPSHMTPKIPKRRTELVYQEVPLRDILTAYAKGFKLDEGTRLVCLEHYVDQQKGVVIFKLFTEGEWE